MILLLDQDTDFRSCVARNLRENGHQVAELDSADELGHLEGLGEVTAVVLDANASGFEGLDLVDRFHRRYPDAPVIIATACRDLAAHPEVHTRDYLYCFCKPLTSSALSRVIDVLLPAAEKAA